MKKILGMLTLSGLLLLSGCGGEEERSEAVEISPLPLEEAVIHDLQTSKDIASEESSSA